MFSLQERQQAGRRTEVVTRRPEAARRLLQDTVVYGAAAVYVPPQSSPPAGLSAPLAGSQPAQASFNAASHFNPSIVVVTAILLSAFILMGFFSLYVRRCRGGRGGAAAAASFDGAAAALADGSSQGGLDPRVLLSLPVIAYSSAKKKGNNVECVVCLAEFEEQEPLRQLPGCRHVFHPDCVDMWLFSHSTCPLCRRKIGAASGGAASFRWGSGSFRHLPFLSRGSSVVPQNNAPAESSEDAGTMAPMESGTGRQAQSNRRAATGVYRSASAEMSSNASSIRRPWQRGSTAAIGGPIGEVHGQEAAAVHDSNDHGLLLGRANSTGHCLPECSTS